MSQEKVKSEWGLLEKLLFSIAMGLLVVVVACMLEEGGVFKWFSQHEYRKCVKEWNESIAQGIYLARIDDERLILEVHQKGLTYVKREDNGEMEDNVDMSYSEVTYIKTSNKTVWRTWIPSNQIRRVKSNWGLTQDVEQLQKKLDNKKDKKRRR